MCTCFSSTAIKGLINQRRVQTCTPGIVGAADTLSLYMQVTIAQKQYSEAEHTFKRVEIASRHHASMQTQCDNAKHKLSRQQQLSAAVEASYKQCISGTTHHYG